MLSYLSPAPSLAPLLHERRERRASARGKLLIFLSSHLRALSASSGRVSIEVIKASTGLIGRCLSVLPTLGTSCWSSSAPLTCKDKQCILKHRTASLNITNAQPQGCHSHPGGLSPFVGSKRAEGLFGCIAPQAPPAQPSARGMRPCDPVAMGTMGPSPATMTRWDLPRHPKTDSTASPTQQHHSAAFMSPRASSKEWAGSLPMRVPSRGGIRPQDWQRVWLLPDSPAGWQGLCLSGHTTAQP